MWVSLQGVASSITEEVGKTAMQGMSGNGEMVMSIYETSKRCKHVEAHLSAANYYAISEADWTFYLVSLAEYHRWRVVHFPDSIKILGHAGAPDLLMMRNNETITAELKTEKGRLSRFQKMWQLENPETYWVWRPSNWQEVNRMLA